ncbi:hypothetical protein CQA66_08305 [Helicobacter aurati]|uniref:Uncharacterized protein n=1 Tax=Helicobacter aurati TaxID=137778 RepID=A0A3D8IZL7_9HELI|nr:hypothetical protein [Helicobacter aurati]RDU70400.1 hypothetical protein CQA66_08305 [Helicobacter aurati]
MISDTFLHNVIIPYVNEWVTDYIKYYHKGYNRDCILLDLENKKIVILFHDNYNKFNSDFVDGVKLYVNDRINEMKNNFVFKSKINISRLGIKIIFIN